MPELYLNFFGFRIRVSETGADEMTAGLARAFPGADFTPFDGWHAHLTIEHLPHASRLHLNGKHEDFVFGSSWPQIDDFVQFLLVQHHAGRFVFAHASCVAKDGQCMMFCGQSTSGKTTLAQTLASRKGCAILCDDIVPIELETGLVYPLRTAPRIRPRTKQILSTPNASGRAASPRTGGARPARLFCLTSGDEPSLGEKGTYTRNVETARATWHKFRRLASGDPPGTDPAAPGDEAPLLQLREPDYFARPPRLAKLPHSAALRYLMKHLRSPAPAPAALLAPLTGFLAGVDCYALTVGCLEPTLDLILNRAGLRRGSPQSADVTMEKPHAGVSETCTG